jgi:2-hydroxy-3-keto-5-methylthiopentenyl-1-phosphate phosphatase
LSVDIKLDPGFAEFYAWANANAVPVVIVSRSVCTSEPDKYSNRKKTSGMAPLIRAVLSKSIGNEEADKMEIISNDVKAEADGRWYIQYRHPER